MKRSDGEVCPHCGGRSGMIVSERAVGWVKRYVDWDGFIVDTDFTELREIPSASGICIDCGRRVANTMDETFKDRIERPSSPRRDGKEDR